MDRTRGTEELWRLTLQHSPTGMALVGTDGSMQVVNRALCDMLGYEPEVLRSKRFPEITHPDDLHPGLELFEQSLAGTIDSFRVRKRYVRGDGTVMWAELSAALVRQEDGSPLHFIAQLLDVTEEHDYEERLAQANRELEAERRTLEAIFDTVDVGLLLIGPDGTYERMNRRHAETLALPYPDGHHGKAGQPGHVFGADGRTPLSPEELPSYRAMQGEEFDDVRIWSGADPARRAAFSVSARRVRDRDGEVMGAALAYKEITELMRAIQVKEDFVASVSHELRTPLASVLGHLEMLRERHELPAEVMRQLLVVERNALRLRALVSDLLEVAQASDGGLRLQRSEVDLSALGSDALEASRPQAEAAGVTLVLDAPPRLVAKVDGERLRQVFDNLLSNAVKYTGNQGTVRVRLQGDDRAAHLWVSDTGMGMEPAEAEQVFSWFVRGEQAVQRQIPGTGLGLNIVRTIVTAHGGAVTVQSTPGEGSTFHVSLPHVG